MFKVACSLGNIYIFAHIDTSNICAIFSLVV
uniref:Uncharacterized protein n=1 Tax=Rhizophora mucronata TaxID=61149 RepID=A0A2P2NGC5_RHIMU